MQSRPLVSILCITYKRRTLVVRCLQSCLEQDYPNKEIIVLVNASGDGTEEAVRQEFPQVKIIRTHKNIGSFPAYNLGIANATGDYVMAVDDDAYFMHSDAVTKLVKAFEEEPVLGAVTCNLEGPNERPIAGRDRYVPHFAAGFTMLPRKVFTDWVGYYPDIFYRDAGETYVFTALWDMGRRIKKLSKVRMYHERAIQGRSDRDWKFYSLRDQILVALMREPWFVVVPVLASKWVKSLVQYARRRYFATWVLAWISALFHVPAALRFRRPIRWRTRKLLWRLYRNDVCDSSVLPESR